MYSALNKVFSILLPFYLPFRFFLIFTNLNCNMKKIIDKNKKHKIINVKNKKIKNLTKKIEKNKKIKEKKTIFY